MKICLAALNQLIQLWEHSSGEDRLALVRGLFEYLVVDLTTQKISDFRLHPGADQYLILRGELYGNEVELGLKTAPLPFQAMKRFMIIKGVGTVPLPTLNSAVNRLLDRLYSGLPFPIKPITEKHVSKAERNQLICMRYSLGESLEVIAKDLGLSHQRIHQLLQRWC